MAREVVAIRVTRAVGASGVIHAILAPLELLELLRDAAGELLKECLSVCSQCLHLAARERSVIVGCSLGSDRLPSRLLARGVCAAIIVRCAVDAANSHCVGRRGRCGKREARLPGRSRDGSRRRIHLDDDGNDDDDV